MAKRPTCEELEQKVRRLEEDAVEHKRMEEELQVAVTREQEQASKSEAIIAGIGAALTIIDTDFRILYENKIHQGIFGKHIGEYCYMAYQNRDQVCGGCPAAESLKNGKIHTRERTVQSEKGTQHFEITASPFLSSTGKIAGVIEVVRDTTKHKLAEEALKRSEKILSSTLEALDGLLVVIDRDRQVILSNWKGHDFVAEQDRRDPVYCYKAFKHLSAPCDYCPPMQTFADGQLRVYEDRNPVDGSFKEIHVTPIFDDVGKVAMVVEYVQDITERKRAEEAKEQSELQYRDLYENAPNAYFSVRVEDGSILRCNSAALRLLGYDKKTFIGMKVFDLYADTPDGKSKAHRIFKRFRAGESIRDVELQMKRRNGDPVWISLSIEPARDDAGSIVESRSVVIDISERKQAEEALRESEEQYHRIVNTAQEGIWVVDAEAKVNYVNQQLGDMLGYTVEEILGSYLFDFMEDLSPAAVGESLKGHTQETTGLTDFRFRRKDGSDLWGMVSSSPMFDDNAQFVGALGMIIDVTKRKQAEEALRRSREELRDLATHLQAAREQERTIIAREIHDDLGQNLSALKIDLTSLEKRLPKDEEALIDKTKSIAKFIDTIVQSVKRIYSGLRPFLLDDLGLIPAMEWMARGFQDRTGIKCELFISPEDIVIDKDFDTTIFRIFQEALTNAGSHANATSVKVSLGEKGTDLILIVSDNGKGITEKQVSDSKSFGLMGMRERALSVGGEVNIRGIQNEGTTVKVKIPRKK